MGNIKMNIRRMFMTIAAVMSVSAVFADSASVTSKKYVDDFMTGYQDKIPGSGTNKLMIYDDTNGIGEKQIVSELGTSTSATDVPNVGAVLNGLDGKQETFNGTAGYVMTGMGYDGTVGEKPIYGTSSRYTSALVTAETVNTAVTNAVNGSLIRVDENGDIDPDGTLWEIVDDLTALNICSNYAPATGTVVQNGTPTPTNPILPTFYQDGDMILRAVGNYADSYDATTNKITRHVGVKVLTGTENWGVQNATSSPTVYFLRTGSDTIISTPCMCTHYKGISNASSVGDLTNNEMKYGYAAQLDRIYIRDDRFSNNVTSFKAYLAAQYAAGTPVVVYYPLATPVEESMPPRCQ